MRIIIFGLGHIGVVLAANLLREGHTVIGIDIDDEIRDCLAQGLSPFHESDIAGPISTGHMEGRLSVAKCVGDAVDADLAFVCVGTRGQADGTLDLSDLKVVTHHLGEALRLRSADLSPMLLVFRSTMLPGSMNGTILPTLAKAAGEPAGSRYEVVFNPDFTREGSAVVDYLAPARIIIGERCPGSARVLLDLLNGVEAPIFTTSFEVAELTKFADNSFHALKVAFANEIGRFALRSGIPPGDVFDLFQADTKLNISASYLRPGGAFGGPCLPKDVRALAARMKEIEIAAPVIDHIVESNSLHMNFLATEIDRRIAPRSRILLVGLSFKTGTDDVRESSSVNLAESLLDFGHHLSIHDPDLTYEGAVGALAKLPSRLLPCVLSHLPPESTWDLVVISKESPEALRLVDENAPVFRIDRL